MGFKLLFLIATIVAQIEAKHPSNPPQTELKHSLKTPRFSPECIELGRKIKETPLDAIPEKCKLLKKIQRWRLLRRHESSFEEGVKFLNENPQWPIRSETIPELERLITSKTQKKTIQKWFNKNTPQTYEGLISFLTCNISDNKSIEKRRAILSKTWKKSNIFTLEQQEIILKKYKSLLNPEDHQHRIEMLLWKNEICLARPLLPQINKNKQATYIEWIERLEKPSSLKKALSTHPGIVNVDAADLLTKDNAIEAGNSFMTAKISRAFYLDPSFFLTLQQTIRKLLLNKQYSLAKELAVKGVTWCGRLDKSRIDFLWLCGWIQTQYSNNPKYGMSYLIEAYKLSTSSNERAQLAFWIAKAARNSHNPKTATNWLITASLFPQTFYGQIAQRDLGEWKRKPDRFSTNQNFWKSFQKKELVRAIQLMSICKQEEIKNILVDGLAQNLRTLSEFYLGRELLEIYATPYYQIHFFEQANRVQNLNSKNTLIQMELHKVREVDSCFVHALIFNESRFHPSIKSNKNAMGLMQITPLTARHLRNKKHAIDDNRLYSDPKYHLTIGEIYLHELFLRFNKSYLLTAMAYNSGPTYTSSWLRKVERPRDNFDIEWIEMINLKETRNYVKKVLGTWLRYKQQKHPQKIYSPQELLNAYQSGI